MGWQIFIGVAIAFIALIVLVEFLALSFVVLLVAAVVLAIALAVYAVLKIRKRKTQQV